MVDGLIHLTWQVLAASTIYGLMVLAYTLLGAYKNINIWKVHEGWDWKLWANGLVKYGLLGVATMITLLGSYTLLQLAPSWGVEVAGAEQISTKVIFGVIAAGIVGMVVKNIQKIAEIIAVPPETVAKMQKTALETKPDAPLLIEAPGIVLPDDYIAKKLADEQVGGIGSVYSVPTGSYDEFRNAVNGNGYNIDNSYGEQCWDGAALLWQQLGKLLYTGNGLAIGCWDLKRDVNRYDLFDLVTNVADLQRGDVVCMRPNHIGFFDGWDGTNMRILGQNQRGQTNGSPFNVVTIARGAFAGAFRYKKWHVAQSQPTPQPAPVPAQPAKKTNEQVAAEVIRGDWGNGSERKRRLIEAGYDFLAIQAIVNQKTGSPAQPGVDVAPPAPAPQPAPAVEFKVGDIVVPTALVSWDGVKLMQYDPSYTISELKGKRAVLKARGQVWAAISTDNLRRV